MLRARFFALKIQALTQEPASADEGQANVSKRGIYDPSACRTASRNSEHRLLESRILRRRGWRVAVLSERVMSACRRIVLASRPVGAPTLDNFRIEAGPIPAPAKGQLLVRTLYLSLDPYMRGRMSSAPSYAQPVAIGNTMEGEVVAEVIISELGGLLNMYETR